MVALKRVTRYLKGTRDFVNKLELDGDVDKHLVKTGWVFRQTLGWFDRPEISIERRTLR